MNLVEILEEQAGIRPGAPAIVDVHNRRSRTLTFGELALASRRAAALLQQAGLKPGDTVLVLQPMSAELYIALVAILRLGLVAMFLDPSAGREHIERCCALRPPVALIAKAKAHWLRVLSPALRRIPLKFSIGWAVPGAISFERTQQIEPSSDLFFCKSNTPALITFTSGSTGEPRAALRTHGFLLAQHRVLEKCLQLVAGETDLTTLPIFLLANLASGVTSVIPNADLRFPGAIDPAPVMEQIRTNKVTRIGASPALIERLVDFAEVKQEKLSGLQKIFTGGAPVFPRLLERLGVGAPQAQIFAVYGSTEAEPIAQVQWSESSPADRQLMVQGGGLLAGRPVAEIEIRVLRDQWGMPIGPLSRDDFAALCVSPGKPGEIVVSGEHVLRGYLNGNGDAETKFHVDNTTWHRTGDAGYFDAQGRLWLLGRCSAKIEGNPGTLYPFSVECAAQQFPGIRRATAMPQGDRRVLIMELRKDCPSMDRATVEQLFAWAHIDAIRIIRRIPVDRRHNGKIDYAALKKLHFLKAQC
jgi:acyl-CoA synthetase (AMP-forming)/AMP-acid ligase II